VGLPSEDQLLKLVRFQDAVAAEELQGQEEGPVLADVVATAYEGHLFTQTLLNHHLHFNFCLGLLTLV
jgi:hypothetical protein